VPIVDTRSGKVEGAERDGYCVFKGIPFAAPPLGERRWRPPVREKPWDGVRDATRFGAEAAQAPNAMARFSGGTAAPRQDEDCLYLNVWTPGCDDARRPVLVWIHGGAFVFGSGSTPWYHGGRFAQHGVVLVTLNYRLGPLGFLHLGDLFGDALAGSGNAGLLDQVAALEWVRENIAAFGGDPDRVTMFGESAGAASVGTLLGMPAARGLVRGAIAQSGAASWFSWPDEATEFASRFVEALGVRAGDVDALRSCSTQQILDAMRSVPVDVGRGRLPYQPVVDGHALPRPPLDAIREGSADGVALITGTNRHEMTLFNVLDPELGEIDDDRMVERLRLRLGAHAHDIVAAYRRRAPDASPIERWTELATDAVFRIPALRLADAQRPHGPVWVYRFDWETPVFGGVLRSTHALDLPFVFHNLDRGGTELFTGTGEERRVLADAMHGAWVAFAQRGEPNGDGLTPWPRYEASRRPVMVFGPPAAVEDDPDAAIRDIWDGAIP
jgi:para-nitrobenzyl esterase